MIKIPPDCAEVWVLAGSYRETGAAKGDYEGYEKSAVWVMPMVKVRFPNGVAYHYAAEDVFASQEEAEAEIALRVFEGRSEEAHGSTDLIHWQKVEQ